MKEPIAKEEKLTLIVAVVGILLFILLAIATSILWNNANPLPKAPGADPPVATTGMNPVLQMPLAENPRHNVTEMYLRTHKADLLEFPQNISNSYDAYYVPLETVRMYAAIEMAMLMPVYASGKFRTDTPIRIPVGDPTIVFDEISGKRVCYDFYSVPSSSGSRAFVTIAANRLLGDSFVRAGFAFQDNEQMDLEKAQYYFDRNFSGYSIQSVRFVSGCWGKIVQLHIVSPDSGDRVVNMDYWGIVDERRCGGSTDDIPAGKIPSLLAVWNESDARYRNIEGRLRTEGINLSASLSQADAEKIRQIITRSY
nr:hypothetical protein [uncultured Methanoregula sp.]